MNIFASTEDDLPIFPGSWVDSKKYYAAFLRAEAFLAEAPKAYRDSAPERRLHELTTHFYAGGDQAGALYRKRDDASEVLTGIWLSGIRELAGWYAASNQIPQCNGLEAGVLADLPRRFLRAEKLPHVSPYLAQFGIALVYDTALPGMKLDGAVFRIPTGQIVIGMSLRYARLDNYWFTLLHELAHVVLHINKLEIPILDNLDLESDDLIEKQADRLAGDSLVPRNEWRSCPARYTLSISDINDFAAKSGISPQSVAGRLRRETGKYEYFSEIVNQYNTREILGVEKL